MRFTRFLAGNAVLADKIRFALCRLSFLDICTDRCAGAQQLVGQCSGG